MTRAANKIATKIGKGRPTQLAEPSYVAKLTALYGVVDTQSIAQMLGVTRRTVQKHVRRLGLSEKTPPGATDGADVTPAGSDNATRLDCTTIADLAAREGAKAPETHGGDHAGRGEGESR